MVHALHQRTPMQDALEERIRLAAQLQALAPRIEAVVEKLEILVKWQLEEKTRTGTVHALDADATTMRLDDPLCDV